MLKITNCHWLFLCIKDIKVFKIFRCITLILLFNFSGNLVLAQEGTKQLMPSSSDKCYIEIYGDGNFFASYSAPDRERLHISLNTGEKVFLGMKMLPMIGDHTGDATKTTFRVKDPSGAVVYAQTAFPTVGSTGYIDTYTEAVTGANGTILNGTTITEGYDPLSFTATVSGDYYIEFETWTDATFTTTDQTKSRIQYFDVTVTDNAGNIITNTGEPSKSAGRLWSKQWSLTTTSFTSSPVKTDFYIYTSDGFVNKVNYEMRPFGFVFVSNSFGVKKTSDAFENRRSIHGNAFVNDVSEHQIFLSDPDHTLFPNSPIQPVIKVWMNNVKIFDFDYNRTPQTLTLTPGIINIDKNDPSCPHENMALFRIESNIVGQAQLLLDIDGGGFDGITGNDRALYVDVEDGTTYFPWNVRDKQGNIHADGAGFDAQFIFLLAGITHFPLFDVENMENVTTESIRPFPRLGPTLYWDDTNIDDPPNSTVTIDASSAVLQLSNPSGIDRKWVYNGNTSDPNNGNMNTINSWFSGLEMVSNFQYGVTQSTICINNDHDKDIIFDVVDLDDDNDGIPDLTECPEGTDPSVDDDNDGIWNYQDADISGFTDSNTDGINDVVDKDLDGIPDFFDLDADNDGIMDVIEAEGTDTDENGIILGTTITDDDKDGLEDSVDPEVFGSTPGVALNNPDTDSDGVTNAEDVDSDNDGIPDNREGQTSMGYVDYTFIDSDEDGLDDAYDLFFNQYNTTAPFGSYGNPVAGGNVIDPVNTDGTDARDYVEQDADNDSAPDWVEGFDDNEDGSTLADLNSRAIAYETANGSPAHYTATDGNSNGISDWMDDEDSDNIPNFLDKDNTIYYRDSDADGLVDLYDSQSNGVGYGLSSGTFSEPDNDGNGTPSYRDIGTIICLKTPLTTFTGDVTVCEGEDITLTAIEEGATYTWKKGSSTIGSTRNLVINSVSGINTGSDYTLEVSKDGCSAISSGFSITVASPPSPALTVSVSASQICAGESAAITISGSETDVSYQLREGTNNVGNPQTGDGSNLVFSTGTLSNAGDKTYHLLATKSGCSSVELTQTVSVKVVSPPSPALTVSVSASQICAGESATITISGSETDVSYQLREGTNNVGNPQTGDGGVLTFSTGTLNSEGSNTYNILATRTYCSSVQLSQTVTITTSSEVNASVIIEGLESVICAGNTAILRAIPENGGLNPSYQWKLNGVTVGEDSEQILLQNLVNEDQVQVIMTPGFSCASQVMSELVVAQVQAPAIAIDASATKGVVGCTITLEASGAENYTWIPFHEIEVLNKTGNKIEIKPQETTTYTVTGIDENGCEGEASITITILPAVNKLFIPTLFTPNNDGKNDMFLVHGECIQEIRLQVFDRAGNLMYEANTIEEVTEVGWNGWHRGQQQPSGKYIWFLEGKYTDGEKITYEGKTTGKINLLR